MKIRVFTAVVLMVTVFLFSPVPGWGGYPERALTMFVNYAAGGGTDLSGRAIAKEGEKFLGQPIAVVNKVGASGTVGCAALAASRPDGYTIGVINSPSVNVAPHTFEVPYNPLKDFEYIAGYARGLTGILVREDSQFKSLKDLIDFARANPGKVKYTCTGLVASPNFAMSALGKVARVKWEPVVFATTQGIANVLGGNLEVAVADPPDVVRYMEAKRLRLLASLADIRWPWNPDAPTAMELGYNVAAKNWMAVAAPKGVPQPIMQKLKDAFKKGTMDPEFIKAIEALKFIPAYYTGDEFQGLVSKVYKEYEAISMEMGVHKSQKK